MGRLITIASVISVAAAAALGACGDGEQGADEPGGLPEQRFEPAVAEGFFGINGQGLRPLAEDGELELLERHLSTLEAGGVDFIRANVDWPRLEPLPPQGDAHSYEFAGLDAWVGALAAHGLEWDVAVMGVPTPAWAADPGALKVCGSRAAPARPADLAALAGALAERYGRDGEFWRRHPDLEPVPITDYELWNEPNIGSFWCPVPDPEDFAALAEASADAILAVDPQAKLVLGGLAAFERTEIRGPGDGTISVHEFLERMLRARPALARKLDVVGVHAYGARPDGVFHSLAYQRQAADAAGLGRLPLSLNETGWYTSGAGDTPPVSESARAANLATVTDAVARSNCGLDSFAPHTWVTAEANLANIEDWYGIADPASGEPKDSGAAYLRQVLLFEGRGEQPPPTGEVAICAGPEGGG